MEMEGAQASDSGVDETLADPQASSSGHGNASNPSGNNNGGGGGGGGTTGQSRSRVTVVCQECKRLKLKCDRKFPCASCLKRNTVERCLYSAAAAEKVDMHSLNNRLMEMEAIMGAYSRGVPIDFTPTYPPAFQAMEERVAGYTAHTGGVVNTVPQAPSVLPSDHRHHHHDAASAATQPFLLSGPVDIARSYGCALCEDAGEPIEVFCKCDEEGFADEEQLKIKEEPTSEDEDEDTNMCSTGSSAMSGISIPASVLSKAKGKGKMPRRPVRFAPPTQPRNPQAFLPPASTYYIEQAPSAPSSVSPGVPVSNPNPPTSFSGPESAPLFYASTPDHLQPHPPQTLSTFSTTGLVSVAATPLASPSNSSPMGPPPPPVRENQELASRPSVTLQLLVHLPETESGLQYLRNAMHALNCFILDLGLPRHIAGTRLVGWNALFKRYQKRLARRGSSEAGLGASSTGRPSNRALAPRLKEKPNGSRKGPASTSDAIHSSAIFSASKSRPSNREGTASNSRLGQTRVTKGASPSSLPSPTRSSVQSPAPVPASSKSGKSRLRDDTSVTSSDSPPSQHESLPYFALTAALMAVGALNSPPVRGLKTDSSNKFGTVDHSGSPSFLYALSQQALSVWMEGGQPLPAGIKDEQASTKEMRADFLRACLVGLHYLMATAGAASSIRFCTRKSKHDSPGRQAILSLIGKMVTALRSWGYAEGLLSSSDLKAEEPCDTTSQSTSTKKATSTKNKRSNGRPGNIQNVESDGVVPIQKEEREDVRNEKEETKIRVLWDVYYYDFLLSDAFGEQSLVPASCFSTPLPSLPPPAQSGDPAGESQRMDEDANGDNGVSSKDREKVKEEGQRMRLEQVFLAQRASLTRLAFTIKQNLSSPDCCCGHTLDQAVRMENSIKEWIDGVPSELRWAFKHGIENKPSELVAMGKTVLEDDAVAQSHVPESQGRPQSVPLTPEAIGAQSRRRVLSCELALVSQLIIFKIFSPFVSDYLAKGGPTPEPQSSVATALRHVQAPAQAIIRISRLMDEVWESAAHSKRSTFHTTPSLKPPLLGLYPLEQLLLDATMVCSRICCGFLPDEHGTEPGMDRSDPCNSEMMLSIWMGLSLLERLHGSSQSSQSGRNSSASIRSTPVDIKLVELVRKRWKAKSASLAPINLKRDRRTMEAEDRQGEDGDLESHEEDPEVSIPPMDALSDSEDGIPAENPQHSEHVSVGQIEDTHHDPTVVTHGYSPVIPGPPVKSGQNPLAKPSAALASSLLASAKAKKGKEKEKGQKKTKHVIRLRSDGSTGQRVEPMKPPPNPPFTRVPLSKKTDKTSGRAETPRNEFVSATGHTGYSPPTSIHPSPMHSEIPKLEYDNSALSSLAQPQPGIPHNIRYAPDMNEVSGAPYTTSYSSSDTMMSISQPHYEGETHGPHSYAPPHINPAYHHHTRHAYAPPPPSTPVYGPASHPQTPLSANPVPGDYFGHQADPQPSSVYYVEQPGYDPSPMNVSTVMRQPGPVTNSQPYELSNQMGYGTTMAGHPEPAAWGQTPESVQPPTHDQGYSWQTQPSSGW